MQKYYVAYGSNMSISQMKHRCPNAIPIGTATLKDWALVFRYHATIEPQPGSIVPVVVWEISDSDEQNLDYYEGYPNYYKKQYISVEVNELKSPYTHKVRAMVYIMVDGVSKVAPPSDVYLDGIEAAYKHFGFAKSVLRNAVEDSICAYLDSDTYAHYY